MLKVWHNNRTFSKDRDKPALFPDHFTLVAEVAHDELGAAYHFTNSFDKAWWENPEVHKTVEGPTRSTSVGDVIETPDGALHLVAAMGFSAVVDGIVDWRDAYA